MTPFRSTLSVCAKEIALWRKFSTNLGALQNIPARAYAHRRRPLLLYRCCLLMVFFLGETSFLIFVYISLVGEFWTVKFLLVPNVPAVDRGYTILFFCARSQFSELYGAWLFLLKE